MPDIEEKLSDSARDALMEIAKRLASGEGGHIELDYNQGGVRNLRVTEDVPVGKKSKRDKT